MAVFVYLFLGWGWAIVVLIALAILFSRRASRRARYGSAAILLIFALCWQQAFAPFNFGRSTRATSPDGQCTVQVNQSGMWTYEVVLTRQGRKVSLPHRSARSQPGITRVQWINNSMLAIDQQGNAGYVFDLAEYDRVVATDEEHGWMNQAWRRAPLLQEQAYFRND